MTNEIVNVSDQLVTILMGNIEKTGGYLNNAVEFTMAQAPLVVQDFLQWSFWSNIFIIGILLGSIGLMGIIYRFIHRWAKKKENFEHFGHPGYFLPTMVMGIISIVFLSISFHCLYTAVQIKVAPRVFLIEKCAAMVNPR